MRRIGLVFPLIVCLLLVSLVTWASPRIGCVRSPFFFTTPARKEVGLPPSRERFASGVGLWVTTSRSRSVLGRKAGATGGLGNRVCAPSTGRHRRAHEPSDRGCPSSH